MLCFAAQHDLLLVPSTYQESTGPSFLSGMQQIFIDSIESACEMSHHESTCAESTRTNLRRAACSCFMPPMLLCSASTALLLQPRVGQALR